MLLGKHTLKNASTPVKLSNGMIFDSQAVNGTCDYLDAAL
jgi:hypothetical protein